MNRINLVTLSSSYCLGSAILVASCVPASAGAQRAPRVDVWFENGNDSILASPRHSGTRATRVRT